METTIEMWQADRVETCDDSEVFDEMRQAVRLILWAEGTPQENDQCMFRLKDVMDARLKSITLPEEDENSLRSNTPEIVTVRHLRAYKRYRQEKISLHECIEQLELDWQKTFMTEKETQLLQKMKDYYTTYDPKTNARIVPKSSYKPLCEEIENWKPLFQTHEEQEEEKKMLTPLETINVPMSSRDIEDPTTSTHQLKKTWLMNPEYELQMCSKESEFHLPLESYHPPPARIGQSQIPRTMLLANKLGRPMISFRPHTRIGQSDVPLQLSEEMSSSMFSFHQSEMPVKLTPEMSMTSSMFSFRQSEMPVKLTPEMVTANTSAVHVPEWTKRFEPKEPEIRKVQKACCATFLNGHKVLIPKGTEISALDEGYMLKRSDSF